MKKEKVETMWLKLQKMYAKKRPFSDDPLKLNDFSDKYWLAGNEPYQYHTLRIEDGRSELEQLIINDIRALKELATENGRMFRERMEEKQRQIDEGKKRTAHVKTLAIAAALTCAVQTTAVLATLIRQVQQNHRNT